MVASTTLSESSEQIAARRSLPTVRTSNIYDAAGKDREVLELSWSCIMMVRQVDVIDRKVLAYLRQGLS